jgi:GATA-binding protein
VSSAPARNIPVAPRRLRKQGKGGGQDLEMGEAEDTSGKAPTRKNTLQATTVLSHGQVFPGAMGQGVSGPGSGPQEWEWLTMSL